MKSVLMFVLKGAVSVGLIYILSRSIAWSEVGEALQGAKYSLMVLALIILLGAQLVSSLRFLYIVRVLDGVLDFSTSLRAHFVGLWFNQVLPTSLGGDAVKVATLKKALGLGVAIKASLLDRLSGLLFILLAIAVVLPMYLDLFPSHPELTLLLGVIAVGGWGTIVLLAWTAIRVLARFETDRAIMKPIRIFADIWSFRKGPPLWDQIWTSAIMHFSGIISYMLLGFALGVSVNPVVFLLIVPVVFLIALIPVSFAGWGLREAGAVWLFGMAGISQEQALAMSICFGVLLVVSALPGLWLVLGWSLKSRPLVRSK